MIEVAIVITITVAFYCLQCAQENAKFVIKIGTEDLDSQ